MKIWITKPENIGRAVRQVGLILDVPTCCGKAFNTKLYLDASDKNRKYQRHGFTITSAGKYRRINAVCWHGYRDMMAALYELDPNARIKTSMADYRNKLDFENRYEETGYRNVGSIMEPRMYREMCGCEN